MAPRAIWKGHLEIGQLVCPVALHAAASTSERVAFHIVNRKTGHRVRRVFVDAETGEPVERDDQAKGYETDRGKTIVVEEEELAEAVPESDKTLRVEAFIPCGEVDTLYFDRPYYLTPDGEAAETAFAVIRAGLAKRKAAAIARTVLFRRLRPVLIRAQGAGLVADTLEFDHEVRDAAKVFDDIPELKLDKEMLDLARHIIDTKRGKFQPERFEDRYDDALAALVKAKAEGKAIPKPKPPEAAKPIDLMEALRKSAAAKAKAKAPAEARGLPAQGRLTWRSRPTAPSATSAPPTSRPGPTAAATATPSWCRSTRRGGCTTTSASRSATRWRAGRSPAARASCPATSGSRCTSRTIRSTMPTSRARSRRASTAAAR